MFQIYKHNTLTIIVKDVAPNQKQNTSQSYISSLSANGNFIYGKFNSTTF